MPRPKSNPLEGAAGPCPDMDGALLECNDARAGFSRCFTETRVPPPAERKPPSPSQPTGHQAGRLTRPNWSPSILLDRGRPPGKRSDRRGELVSRLQTPGNGDARLPLAVADLVHTGKVRGPLERLHAARETHPISDALVPSFCDKLDSLKSRTDATAKLAPTGRETGPLPSRDQQPSRDCVGPARIPSGI